MIRILLAEDDEAMRSHLARLLKRAGYAVVAAASGDEAVPLLEDEHFDLLLSDVIMPGVDGIELARVCERVSPATRIVFITGFAAITLTADIEAPRARSLSKPFHLRELVSEVRRIFELDALAGL